MLIDKLRAAFVAGVTLAPVREWNEAGHEVGLYRVERPADGDDPGSSELMLACECDCPEDGAVRVIGGEGDPDRCAARLAAHVQVTAEAHASLAPVLGKDGVKAAVLEAHRRVEAKEWLGQHYASMIYVQEIAEILGVPQRAVWQACDELYAEEKLELNGAILAPYVPRFRLPKELAAVIAYAIEEPLGWPNGDAGACHVAELERTIQDATGVASGKAAFGDPFPHADKALLADMLAAIAKSLRDAAKDRVTFDLLKNGGPDLYRGPALMLKTFRKSPANALVLAHCAADLVAVAFQRIELDAAMRVTKVTPAVTLGEMADYYEAQAARLRQ